MADNTQAYHVYGIGAALVDTEIEVTDQDLTTLNIDKGVMTLVDEARQQELIEHLSDHLVASKRASGGSAANTIIAASYFGAKAFYSCKVASDDNGDFYLQDLSDAGVDSLPSNVRETGVTGKCLVMITPDAERTMNTYLGISETVSSRELSSTSIAASQYAYIEGYLVSSDTGRAAAIELRKQAEAKGVKTALSLSDPAMVEFFHDGLKEMLGDGVDLLFCNQAEALGFTRTQTLEEAMTALKKIARSFAITLGAEGALVVDGDNSWKIAPHKV
ncbi:adenosine kinase, partial [Pseudomaricurvus sp.]|uniref:adenosine kinase n=1 Tax=Pseudomaricurvus sp. TaxID=2004510 RepID=UPI003F6BBAD0